LIAVNSRVLLVTATIAVTAGLAIGLVPAFASSGRSFMQGLRAGGSRSGTASTTRQRIRSALVVGEVALAVALVVGAGLLSASFVRLISVDLGLDYRGVLTMSVTPVVTGATQPLRTAAGIRAMEDVLQRIRALPGVTEAGALAGALPFSGNTSRVGVSVAGRGDFKGDDASDRYFVTPDYLTVMRLPLLRGRLFTESDDRTDAEPVVLLSQTAARRYFGDADALGETVNMTGNRRVVGIVADMRPLGPESPARPEAYAPLAQGDRPFGSIVVRCNQASPALSAQIRSVVAGVMPQRVVPQPVLLDDLFAPIIASRRFNMLLVGLFGVLALAIAAAGLYGVVSYLVTQRTQEIGVRIALGAAPARVVRMVLGRALTLVTVGVAFGLMLAWAEGGVLRSFLFQVSPHDARVYAGVAAVLLIVGLGAAYVPARRAAKVDPLVALRHD
jgi:predicted permease